MSAANKFLKVKLSTAEIENNHRQPQTSLNDLNSGLWFCSKA
mgnify:CR=1 FL=1